MGEEKGAPDIVRGLVERFDYHRESYRSPHYNEAQLRLEFVDPFFEALGWDVYNRSGYAEAYKDVIHEDAIKVGGATRAPDYCFRIGGTRKFFVETKKPSVSIRDDISPAFQLRRYAWSAKLPLSILTDFEEFAVYDCRVKPLRTDKPSTARVLFLTYREYLDRWEEIASIFSREAVLRGSFDRYVESTRAKKGTAEVDDAFLKDIESWREMLARNLALRNPGLTVRELNFAVQVTLDRIIFLRICEDRGIEDYGRLLALTNGSQVYGRLMELFFRADQRYNSGLFHFQREKGRAEAPDQLTPGLVIDDRPLKEIIRNLYYPDSPYEFSVLPADILGQVYEQFLGKVIRLTPGHRAVVEEKPEVKKAGGVYYTPTYIVDYIVKNTVGKLLDGKTPRQAAELRILDPACGSGSFLIGAYQYLLDWHRDWYTSDDPRRHARGGRLYQAAGGEWRLTTLERKRILLGSIYGVDIDPQAVEVTKLSLLLKVLEGENEQTLTSQMQLFRERALPDLGENIKCGNSLVGTDFYREQQMSLLGEEEVQRINAFDWEREFPEIFSGEDPGFDVVIGNPPYVRQEMLGSLKRYFQLHYQVYHGVADLYAYFIERGVSLLRRGGIFSYIVSNKWMRANYGEPLRRWLKNQRIEEIIDFGDLPVFRRATTYPCIIRIGKDRPEARFPATLVKTLEFGSLDEYVEGNRYLLNQDKLDEKGWSLADQKTQALLEKIRSKGIPLGEYVDGKIYRGILTGLNEAFVIDEETRNRLISEDPKSGELIKPFLLGRDIKRYQPPTSNRYLIFARRGVKINEYPAIERYLSNFKEKLMPRPRDWKGKKWKGRKPGSYKWYEIQDAIDYYEEFEKPKIIIPAIVQYASYAFDENGFYSNDKTTIVVSDNKYMLGLLNSKVCDIFIHEISSTKRGGYFEYKPMYLSKIPIVVADLHNSNEKEIYDRVVELVDRMLELHRRRSEAKTGHERNLLQRQIEATDHQIDQLVYELYDLTPEEIELIEAHCPRK